MSRVVPGLQRWLAEPRTGGLTDGARIGLLLHPASVDAEARHALELVEATRRYHIVRLFAPEHGADGHEQDMESVRDAARPSHGPPAVSLYGDTAASLRPAREHLEDLDAIVYDLQDVGSRYYTFAYTLSFVMEAAREIGLPVVVLDRPNPIDGETLEGPVLDPELSSFVGRFPLPVRHGMTTGELARLFNDAFGIDCDLRVVEMTGWRRSMRFDETGLCWVPPSPNMPTLATATVYPGGCLVEGTELSEGRGTTTPFELVGAPWLDADALAEALRREGLPGVRFRAASFRPMFQKHAGSGCRGVQVIVEDARSFRPFATYLVLLREARLQAPDRFAWRRKTYEFESERLAIDLLLGRRELRPMIESGAALDVMERSWKDDLARFAELRERFLIYD